MSSHSRSELHPNALAPEEPRWTQCPGCRAFVYHKRLKRNLGVCPECNYHFRLALGERLVQLLDDGSFEDLTGDLEPVDWLSFVDTQPYAERLEQAQRKSGSRVGALFGTGSIAGRPIVLAALDFSYIGGSLGSAAGEVITRAAEYALDTRTPLLLISASGGARMQEGCISLMQMAKTSQAIARLHEEGVLCICLLCDPTYGGVTASFAVLGDILISEPGVYIGFAGPRVIEQTIGQVLPERFQTSEFLLSHGMLDLVEPRESLHRSLRRILAFHAATDPPRLAPSMALSRADGKPPATDASELAQRTPWEVVQLARHADRPTTLDYIGHIFDDFQELLGDRVFAQDEAIVGGLATLSSLAVVVLGHQKGHTTSERVQRNFGMPHPEGYRKALRLIHHAAKFGTPVVTFVDTPGAYPGIGAEERGQAIAIARCIMEMSRVPVPIVTVVTGEGGSGGALALAVADRVLIMENGYYSVISPEGCSVILFRDAAAAPRAAAALRVTAPDLLRLGIVDAVVREPEGGAHADPPATARNLGAAIVAALRELVGVDSEDLLARRYDRFRAFGDPHSQLALPPMEELNERS